MTHTLQHDPSTECLSERLSRAAAASEFSLHELGPREFGLDSGDGERFNLNLKQGWLTATRHWNDGSDVDPLARHRDWSGPARIDSNGAVLVNLQLPLSERSHLGIDQWSDDETITSADEFLAQLVAQLPSWLQGEASDAWEPPDAQQISKWLAEAGHTVAIDDQGFLRTVLKRKGCDGQVLIERRTGRLRLVMRLGRWKELSPAAGEAIRKLLMIAMHRTRMVRLTCTEVNEAVLCEAMVDLTGLPVMDDANSVGKAVWSETLLAALDGLQLTLNRLGLELDALADPANSDAVKAFLSMPVD